MQQVSRKLLVAGVLAFGTLAAACGDKINIVAPTTAVPSITGVSRSLVKLVPIEVVDVSTTGEAPVTVTDSCSDAT